MSNGQEAKELRNFAGFLRPGDSGAFDEGGLGSLGRGQQPLHQGAATESHDPDVIAATMAKPGVVLKRPVGSDGPFGENAELPKNLGQDGEKKAARKPPAQARKSSAQPDMAVERKAAQAYERESRRREREEARE